MFEYFNSSVDLYAKSLFNFAKQNNLLDKFKKEIAKLKACLDDKLIELISAPIYSEQEKQQILQKLAQQLELSKNLTNFLKLMSKNNKLHLVKKILDDFECIAIEDQGFKIVEVTVADNLSEPEQKAIKQRLEKILLSKIEISFKIDPAIIGGIIIRLDNKMLDTSVASRLFNLNEMINNKIAQLN